MPKKLMTSFLVILLLCYPFAVYYGMLHFSPRYISLGLLAVLVLRFVCKRKLVLPADLPFLAIGITGIVICLIGMISNQLILLKLYPFFINLLLLALFSYSLFNPPTIIERIARLKEKNLPQSAISYLHKVTLAWCLFFIVNATIALWTCLYSSIQVWTLYNGFIAYCLMAFVFTTEFIIRTFMRKRHHHE